MPMRPQTFVQRGEQPVNPRELRMPATAIAFAVLTIVALAVAVAIRVLL